MKIAHNRDAVLNEKFWFRKNVFERESDIVNADNGNVCHEIIFAITIILQNINIIIFNLNNIPNQIIQMYNNKMDTITIIHQTKSQFPLKMNTNK